jgi:hypothetical protein
MMEKEGIEQRQNIHQVNEGNNAWAHVREMLSASCLSSHWN